MPLISVSHLVKEYKTYDRREGLSGAFLDLFKRDYKTLRAVDDISFEIERGELAASLIHNPKIVFLDEPTIGLDVSVKQSIREFVKRINRERGVTVILTTHDLRDIEELCSRVFIIDKGRQVFDGSLDNLRALS